MSMADYLEENLLTHIFRTSSFSKPTEIGIALLTTAPVDSDTGTFTTGTGVEVANANGYERQTTGVPADDDWSDPSAGTQGETDNVSDITFGPASGGDWGTIVASAIVDSSTYDSGEMLFYGTLTTSKAIFDGDTFKFNAGDLNIQLN
jgi:hypothetical protein